MHRTFSAEPCEGPLVPGLKGKKLKREKEMKKRRKEGRKKKESNSYETETVSPSLETMIFCLPGKVLTTT